MFQHARSLRRRGVKVAVCSPDPLPAWFPEAETFYLRVESTAPRHLPRSEVAVGTMAMTISPAIEIASRLACHLCQGYEPGHVTPTPSERNAIRTAYDLPAKKLVVSPHLARVLREEHGADALLIPQPFEPDLFRPPPRERPDDDRLRVLVSGHWGLEVKGVAWSLRALRPLFERSAGRLDLVRLSLDADPAEVSLWPEAERHRHLAPAEVPTLIQSVDVCIGPSSPLEGFGLVALEAMGCARPTVLTDIPSHRDLDPDGRASLRVPFRNEEALRSAVERLWEDRALRRRLGAAGRRIATRYTEDRTADALLDALELQPASLDRALACKAPAGQRSQRGRC